MKKKLLILLCLVLCLPVLVPAQDLDVDKFRTYDGSYNNRQNVNWGSVGENLRNIVPFAYEDGMSAPAGANRPNPRQLSNSIFAQSGLINDPLTLSDFCWVWGQFLDHDIGITPDGKTEPLMIQVPAGDPWMDPDASGRAIIPMMRNIFDQTTGTDAENPRRHPNMITAFIDGSGVYGSDEERANWLRTFKGGKLKVSEGDMLPFNTRNGEFDSRIDEHAPEMDNPVGISEKIFVAGDVRANENPLLLSFHTLFVREHNRLAEQIARKHPQWNDEQIYQYTRKMVGGFIQAIVYDEYLPAMGVHLPEYTGYDENRNPQLSNVFTAAAFRLGHTLLNGNLQRVMNDGTEHPDGPLTLRGAFFNPLTVMGHGGIDAFLKGMAVQTQQGMDAKVIDDVRNFLFGPPGAGGLDLASININRGRERGLPDFNSVRAAYGLRPYSIFQQINQDNIQTSYTLLSAYRDINEIDPWVGMLAERRMRDALFGETIMAILVEQFQALRDGDRFFYLNDPVLSDEDKEIISNTSLHDIIMRNTSITLMQDDVFKSMPHDQICGNMTISIAGRISTAFGKPVSDVVINLGLGEEATSASSNGNGIFSLDAVGCDTKVLAFDRPNDSHANGLTTLDLILAQKHILNRERLGNPFTIIAADVDNSGSVSTLDLIKMRKVILSIDTEFSAGSAWKFIPAGFQFTDPNNPFLDEFPTTIAIENITSDYEAEYIGIKLGDLNGSAETGTSVNLVDIEPRSNHVLRLIADDRQVQAGQEITLAIQADEATFLNGFQFGLQFDRNALQVVDVQNNGLADLSANNFGIFNEDGLVTTSWSIQNEEAGFVPQRENWFSITFKANANGLLSEFVQLDRRYLSAEAYDENLQVMPVELQFGPAAIAALDQFKVQQNQPNPFRGETVIPFYLPETSPINLTVFNANGKVVYQQQQSFEAGHQQWVIGDQEIPAAGVYYYRIEGTFGAYSLKMVKTQ